MFPRVSVIILLLCTAGFYYENEAARILSIYPTPSVSHQVVFRALTLELAKQGHDVVTITTDPVFTKQNITTSGTITEIDTSHIYDIIRGFNRSACKRGVFMDISDINPAEYKAITFFIDATFRTPAVKSLLTDPKEKFDLILVEAMYYSPLVLGKIFEAPVIWFSSFYANDFNLEAMGAPTRHPILYPNVYRYRIHNLTLWERIRETYIELKIWYTFSKVVEYDIELVNKHFGIETSMTELNNHIDLLFINANAVIDGNRPVPPNVIYLGGLHMQPVKPLAEDLQNFLDSSVNGVVYVSLGTNVYTSLMDAEFIEAFLKAFESLPYDVLWKFDTEDLPRKIKNVHVRKWFPQRDLLVHPKVKAFVFQGGLQSLDEAIESKVPVVGIPVLADQSFNIEQCVKLGIGVKLDTLTFTSDDLIKGINTVINEQSYRQNLEVVSKYIYDQPQSSLDRAVWWVNYVLRNKGAKHLRSPAANISWSEYLMMDIITVILAAVLTLLVTIFVVVKQLKKMFFGNNKKVKSH